MYYQTRVCSGKVSHIDEAVPVGNAEAFILRVLGGHKVVHMLVGEKGTAVHYR